MALTDKLTAIADAIRGKTGKTDSLTLAQMPTEIAGIETAPVLESLTITENGEYTPGEGVDGFSKVVANVAASGGSLLSWEGEIEFSDADATAIELPVDDVTCDRYIVDMWVVETGTVAGGVVTFDDKPTIPANSNRWATVSGITEPFYNGEKVESINFILGTTDSTVRYALISGIAMRGSASYEHSRFANLSGLTISDNGLTLLPSVVRYFCKSGYYAKFRYSVTGIKGAAV